MRKRDWRVRIEFLIREQLRWIEEHGGNLSGYVERYGRPGDENCYGDGGAAIFAADVGELNRLRLML